MYKCNNCGNQSKKEFIVCPIGSCGKVGTYVDIGEVKKNYSIPKVSAKKKLEIENNKGSKSELDKWFEARRGEMKGVCAECGKPSFKNNDNQYKWSICHIAPKAKIPSVATNKYNWIELCWLHHQELDNTFDTASKMYCFQEVKMKFQLFKHLIPQEEIRKINPHLLK